MTKPEIEEIEVDRPWATAFAEEGKTPPPQKAEANPLEFTKDEYGFDIEKTEPAPAPKLADPLASKRRKIAVGVSALAILFVGGVFASRFANHSVTTDVATIEKPQTYSEMKQDIQETATQKASTYGDKMQEEVNKIRNAQAAKQAAHEEAIEEVVKRAEEDLKDPASLDLKKLQDIAVASSNADFDPPASIDPSRPFSIPKPEQATMLSVQQVLLRYRKGGSMVALVDQIPLPARPVDPTVAMLFTSCGTNVGVNDPASYVVEPHQSATMSDNTDPCTPAVFAKGWLHVDRDGSYSITSARRSLVNMVRTIVVGDKVVIPSPAANKISAVDVAPTESKWTLDLKRGDYLIAALFSGRDNYSHPGPDGSPVFEPLFDIRPLNGGVRPFFSMPDETERSSNIPAWAPFQSDVSVKNSVFPEISTVPIFTKKVDTYVSTDSFKPSH